MIRKSLLMILLAAAASAAGLSVRIVDTQGRAIPGATVSLISRSGESKTLTADAEGGCEFRQVADGDYFVEAGASGFAASAPRAVRLPTGDDAALVISLGLAQVRSEVVVTASGTPQSTDEVSKALTVVDRGAMELRADPTVADALLDVPGLSVQQLGGPLSTTYFKTRGLRDTDTAVLVDGLRLRDAAGTQADASGLLQDLVLADTGRIEVLRGAGSSLYGTDAIGGVVNIVTGEGGGRTRGSVSLDGGSLGQARATARLAGGLGSRIDYSLGLTHWNITRGIDDDSPARNTSGQGQILWRLSAIASLSARIYAGDSFGFLRLSPIAVGNLPASGVVNAIAVPLSQLHLYESGALSDPPAPGNSTFLPDQFDPDSTRTGKYFTGALTFRLRPSERLGFTAQYQNVRSTRDYGDGPAGPGYQPTGTSLSDYLGRIQTANARIDYSPWRSQHWNAGYEFEDEDFRNRLTPPTPAAPFSSDVSQRSNAIFAQDQVHLAGDRVQLSFGYRAQFFTLAAPYFEPAAGAPFAGRAFTAPPTAQTGDISAAYTIRRTGTKIRAHAGRGYRAPSLFERFGTYFDGAAYTLYGDPGLRPDRSNSIDGGIDQRLWNSRAQLSATYFFTRLNEVIIFDYSGGINPSTDPLGRYAGYRNTGGGLARGVELSANVAATRRVQFTAAYTYTDSRQQTPVVPGVWESLDSPRHQYSAFATARLTDRLTAVLRYIGTGDYLGSVYGYAFRFSGAQRAQAMLSYRRPLAEFRAVRFYGKVDNMFNQTYYQDGFRTPGATFVTGMQFEF